MLVRGLTAQAIERIDAAAAAVGLSRNEYLRRKFEAEVSPTVVVEVTMRDLRRATAAASDLLDPDVMESAWR